MKEDALYFLQQHKDLKGELSFCRKGLLLLLYSRCKEKNGEYCTIPVHITGISKTPQNLVASPLRSYPTFSTLRPLQDLILETVMLVPYSLAEKWRYEKTYRWPVFNYPTANEVQPRGHLACQLYTWDNVELRLPHNADSLKQYEHKKSSKCIVQQKKTKKPTTPKSKTTQKTPHKTPHLHECQLDLLRKNSWQESSADLVPYNYTWESSNSV